MSITAGELFPTLTDSTSSILSSENNAKFQDLWPANNNGETLSISYDELLKKVSKLSNAIKKLGYKKGDRAVI